jgi:hypothetical protein
MTRRHLSARYGHPEPDALAGIDALRRRQRERGLLEKDRALSSGGRIGVLSATADWTENPNLIFMLKM